MVSRLQSATHTLQLYTYISHMAAWNTDTERVSRAPEHAALSPSESCFHVNSVLE